VSAPFGADLQAISPPAGEFPEQTTNQNTCAHTYTHTVSQDLCPTVTVFVVLQAKELFSEELKALSEMFAQLRDQFLTPYRMYSTTPLTQNF
jgi:hypothetical protein